MKFDTSAPIREEEITEEVRLTAIKKQHKFLGTIIPKNGHTVFELDLKTSLITPATFEEYPFDYTKVVKGDLSKKKKIMTKEMCIYIPSLNKKNALRKFVDKYIKGPADYKKMVLRYYLKLNNLPDH